MIESGQSAAARTAIEQDRSLLESPDVDGITPLHLAAWNHDAELVGWLLDQGAAPGPRARCGEPVQRIRTQSATSPLDFASSSARGGAASRARTSFEATAQRLLSAGAPLTPRAAVALGDH